MGGTIRLRSHNFRRFIVQHRPPALILDPGIGSEAGPKRVWECGMENVILMKVVMDAAF
jgi:hypothetical protein